MATYKERDLRDTYTGDPPLEALLGRKLAKRDRVMSAFANPDRLLGNGRRVVARVGLHGSAEMMVGSADPASGATQIYPTRVAVRTVLRAKWTPTPGHFPVLSALVLPSGMTQKFSLGSLTWGPDIPYGLISIRVDFDAVASETVTWSKVLPVSGEQWAGEKQDPGAGWAALTRFESPMIAPDGIGKAGTLHDWSEITTATATISVLGGVRLVDAVIQERPWAYVRDVASDTLYSTPLVTDGSGAIVKTYPVEYPIDERGPSDPTYGSKLLADVVHRQQTALGPVLASASLYDEASQGVASTDAEGVSTSSTTFVDLLHTSVTGWDDRTPGWSLSSGGNAQQFKTSNGLRETRDKNACVPVRIWVWCSVSGGTGTLRFQSENYSVAELKITSATEAWRSCTGHLRCGLGPEDPSVLVMLGKTASGGDTLRVRHIVAEFTDL